MEPLKKFVLRIALLAAIVTFVSCLLNGISIGTGILRSAVVYLLALLLEIIALNMLRWGIWATAPSQQVARKNKDVNQEKND